MTDSRSGSLRMLLVEPKPLLRRTVSLTAHTLGLGSIREAASVAEATRLLRDIPFHGAVIAIDCETCAGPDYSLELLDLVRDGLSASVSTIPIAVMVEHATTTLLRELRERDISRVIIKPFRARVLLDAFASFESVRG
jgi:CheY-like chemotaxis protein